MKFCLVLLASFLFTFQIAVARVKLPALIRDSMVLQRDVKVKIWGWADKG
jgi:sialate O-acetylesterase